MNIDSERILETKTMTELYDEAYVPRLPVIDDFLYCGTYIYAGAPKIGKSFYATTRVSCFKRHKAMES